MSMYEAFASVYDVMQGDVNYERWIESILNKCRAHRGEPKTILELACGTGTLAIGLSKFGYIVEGVDISDEMLAVAQHKARLEGQKIRFLCQDMSELETRKKYDLIFSMCDGFNYLIEDEAIKAAFEAISRHLEPKGLFIFDVSSIYKLSQVIGDRTFAETYDESAYIWENQYDDELKLLDFSLTLFKQNGKFYERYEEYHTQRAYEIDEMKQFIAPYFEILEILDGDEFDHLKGNSNRIGFICRKK